MGSGHYDTPSIASRPLNRNGFHRGKCQESRGRRPKFAFRGNSRSVAVARNCPNVALCHVHIDPPAASRRCDRWRPKLRIPAGTGCGAFPAPSWRCPCSRCSRSSATVSSPGPPSVGRSKARASQIISSPTSCTPKHGDADSMPRPLHRHGPDEPSRDGRRGNFGRLGRPFRRQCDLAGHDEAGVPVASTVAQSASECTTTPGAAAAGFGMSRNSAQTTADITHRKANPYRPPE